MDITLSLVRIGFLGLAIAVFSIYLTKSVMTESLRRAVDSKFPWIGYALKCTFCTAGWTSLVATLIYTPLIFRLIFNSFLFVDMIAGWFALWGLATLIYRSVWPFLEKNAPKMRVVWSKH